MGKNKLVCLFGMKILVFCVSSFAFSAPNRGSIEGRMDNNEWGGFETNGNHVESLTGYNNLEGAVAYDRYSQDRTAYGNTVDNSDPWYNNIDAAIKLENLEIVLGNIRFSRGALPKKI